MQKAEPLLQKFLCSTRPSDADTNSLPGSSRNPPTEYKSEKQIADEKKADRKPQRPRKTTKGKAPAAGSQQGLIVTLGGWNRKFRSEPHFPVT